MFIQNEREKKICEREMNLKASDLSKNRICNHKHDTAGHERMQLIVVWVLSEEWGDKNSLIEESHVVWATSYKLHQSSWEKLIYCNDNAVWFARKLVRISSKRKFWSLQRKLHANNR